MFASSAQKITSKTSEWLENTLFGRSSDQNATLETAKIDEKSLPDGFSIIDTTSSPQNSNLWMTLQRVKDIALGKLESIDLYAVVDGKLAGIVKENVGITDILRLNLGNYSSFALVRDSGLRNKVEELGNVILSGLMPKNGTAEATDVTGKYENFLGGRSVDFIGGDDEELGGQGGSKEGEADGETHTIAAYDISIINDGEEYQPDDKPIEVTIKDEAIQVAVAAGKTLSLWHVKDDGSVHVRTYHFYTLNEYLEYVEYELQSDTGETVYGQTVRSGERPVAPQNPVNPQDEMASFSGWYEGSPSPSNPELTNIPYDFNQVLDLTEDDVKHLYAKFSRYAYVIFHDQYDTVSESFPVAFTRRVDLDNGTEADWYVDIKQYSVSYEDPYNIDDNEMAFVGWSDAPITVPGASLDDYGEPAAEISNDYGRIYVTDTIHLYPIFKSVKSWVLRHRDLD